MNNIKNKAHNGDVNCVLNEKIIEPLVSKVFEINCQAAYRND